MTRPRNAKATTSSAPHPDPAAFTQNLIKVAEQSQRILQEWLAHQSAQKTMDTPADPLNIGRAFAELFGRMMADPGKLAEAQMAFWREYWELWENSAKRFLGEKAEPVIEPDSKDRRFRDEAWQQSAVFDFLKQSYLLSARWLQHTVHDVEGIDPKTMQKVDFYTRQFVDAMSPSNFILTNPEVLRTTLESNGGNLVKGLKHMLEDLERGNGNLNIRMTDESAFEVGKNLAATPGKVIYENALMQLIQYAPTTKQVFKVPLLIMPAWINKFYILDMQPENSLVKWLVGKGYTVFVISWVNPDEKLDRKTFEDYMLQGPLEALDVIEKITGGKTCNVMGYCLGGTLLASTLAWLAAKKKINRIASATYLTTLVDFEEAGELSVFIDEDQIEMLENRMAKKGYLEGRDMAVTFNMLRANDLIWSFVVNNYLLGKEPFPFDLLYWNADSTRMPAVMHSFYLRNMYQQNRLVKAGGITLAGVPIDLRKITAPTYILSTREDHIAPWKATYAATRLYKGPVRFVLSASGHVAGVINPPEKKKYGHWTNAKLPKSADAWLESAKEQHSSWWEDWLRWAAAYSGPKVPARKIGGGKFKAIENAPGRYVKERS